MTTRQPLYKSLYFQVIVAIIIGILIGHFYPQFAVKLKPFGDGFIKLIKMVIAPIIFCTVVSGIAGMQSMKSVGKTGGYALLYFEIVSTLALIIGLVVVNVVKPGAGMHVDVSTLDASKIASYVSAGADQSIVGFILNVIPNTIVGAFANGPDRCVRCHGLHHRCLRRGFAGAAGPVDDLLLRHLRTVRAAGAGRHLPRTRLQRDQGDPLHP